VVLVVEEGGVVVGVEVVVVEGEVVVGGEEVVVDGEGVVVLVDEVMVGGGVVEGVEEDSDGEVVIETSVFWDEVELVTEMLVVVTGVEVCIETGVFVDEVELVTEVLPVVIDGDVWVVTGIFWEDGELVVEMLLVLKVDWSLFARKTIDTCEVTGEVTGIICIWAVSGRAYVSRNNRYLEKGQQRAMAGDMGLILEDGSETTTWSREQ
jgi:hypothetical protein